jgi:hypothetical protein
MHVDDRRFHHVYEDRRDEGRYTVDRGSHVAFSGGPGGIRSSCWSSTACSA